MRAALLCAFFASILSAQSSTYVLKAARLFDGKSGAVTQPGLAVVSGNKIQSLHGPAPANATVIDLGDATLLPGFIDAHTHLTQDFDPDYNGAQLRQLMRTIPEHSLITIIPNRGGI